MKKIIIKILIFVILLISILSYVNKILKPKYPDGIYSLTKFYEQKRDTIDVLGLGSSHAFESINTGLLYEKYGIASYILGGAMQPMWNTYHYLLEALKYQKPKLIILEAYGLVFYDDYGNEQVKLKNTIGLRFSKNKIENIKASVPKEEYKNYILEYYLYHTRYRELYRDDFYFNKNYRYYDDWKGFGFNLNTESFDEPNLKHIKDEGKINKKAEKYYKKILQLAKEKGIDIIVIVSPYAAITEEDQKKYIKASNIASDYNIPFLNGNLLNDKIGIDYKTDMADYTHLNYKGNVKFTEYLAKYIVENYDIKDRRGDEKYISWDNNAKFIDASICDQIIRESDDVDEILELANNEKYDLFVSVDGKCKTDDENVKELLKKIGINNKYKNGIWHMKNKKCLWESGDKNNKKEIFNRMNDFTLKRYKKDNIYSNIGDTDPYENEIIIDKKRQFIAKNGVNITIYDSFTEELVDILAIDMDNGYKMAKKKQTE